MATLLESAQQTLGPTAIGPSTDFFGPGPMSSAMSARSRAILAAQELQDAFEMRRIEDALMSSEFQRVKQPLELAQAQSELQNMPQIIAAQNTERMLRQKRNQYALDNFDEEVEEQAQRKKLERMRLETEMQLYPLTTQAKQAELESKIDERGAQTTERMLRQKQGQYALENFDKEVEELVQRKKLERMRLEAEMQLHPLTTQAKQAELESGAAEREVQSTERMLRQKQGQYALENFDKEVEELVQRKKFERMQLESAMQLHPLTTQAKQAELESEVAERKAFAPFVSVLAEQRSRVVRAQMANEIDKLDAIDSVTSRAPEISARLRDAEKSLATPGVEDLLLPLANEVAVLPDGHPLKTRVNSVLQQFDVTLKRKDILREALRTIPSRNERLRLYSEGVRALDKKDYEAFDKTLVQIDPSSVYTQQSKDAERFIGLTNDLQQDYGIPMADLQSLAYGKKTARGVFISRANETLKAIKQSWNKQDTGDVANRLRLLTASGESVKFPENAEELVAAIEKHGAALTAPQFPRQVDGLIKMYSDLGEYQRMARAGSQGIEAPGGGGAVPAAAAPDTPAPDTTALQRTLDTLKTMLTSQTDPTKRQEIQARIVELQSRIGAPGAPQ